MLPIGKVLNLGFMSPRHVAGRSRLDETPYYGGTKGSGSSGHDDLPTLVTHDCLLIREPGSAWYISSWLDLEKPGHDLDYQGRMVRCEPGKKRAYASMKRDMWPDLPYAAWKDTYATLHLWTQIVGKIRLAQTPWVNHSWHVTLYVSPRGLTTSSIPYGQRSFELEFDFLKHVLRASNDEGSFREVPLVPRDGSRILRRPHASSFRARHRRVHLRDAQRNP